jgi:serine/threonine-protein kinase RsbW
MARKFKVEFEKTAQTHTLALLPGTSRSRPFLELQQSLPSQVVAIEPFVEQLMRFISMFRNPDGSETHIELALHEALANAVIHGNGEDPSKRVYVTCRCDIDGEVSITIRDQGQGFDSRSIPDPTDPENQMSTHGRGIYLMQASMDEVYFDEGGAVVHMLKKPNAGSAAAADQGSRISKNQK